MTSRSPVGNRPGSEAGLTCLQPIPVHQNVNIYSPDPGTRAAPGLATRVINIPDIISDPSAPHSSIDGLTQIDPPIDPLVIHERPPRTGPVPARPLSTSVNP